MTEESWKSKRARLRTDTAFAEAHGVKTLEELTPEQMIADGQEISRLFNRQSPEEPPKK